MVLFSPRPEQAQLSGSFKSLLLQHDVVLENILIPSPPMSPRFIQEEDHEKSGIVVTPYHQNDSILLTATFDFLAQYRNINNSVETKHKPSASPRSSSSVPVKTLPERSSRRRVPRRNYRADLDIQERDLALGDKTRVRKAAITTSKAVVKKPSTTPQVIASTIPVTQHVPNMSWSKLVDYSPPLSTLPPNQNKCLKIEWKGSSMDLSQDPLKDKLHPAELVLAETLRLPCDLYLDSKRRFFIEKVQKLRKGLPFRRTDAQKACRIDVNKASRLYAAFEKVNWLDDSNFEKYL
ncbi:SWIRM domain-containing protein FUN19 [Nakaseomyces bracarensis]|uniref:SWIRM domain-containing protein FUN19 n=1 Tax=Nakaseomyces bracarensis TaxID=273131 RepID=A0ABR4NNX7_9SACH